MDDRLTKAYQYILERNYGFSSDFIEANDEKTYEALRTIGYISIGHDADMNERWKLTDFGHYQVETSLKTRQLNIDFEMLNRLLRDE